MSVDAVLKLARCWHWLVGEELDDARTRLRRLQGIDKQHCAFVLDHVLKEQRFVFRHLIQKQWLFVKGIEQERLGMLLALDLSYRKVAKWQFAKG